MFSANGSASTSHESTPGPNSNENGSANEFSGPLGSALQIVDKKVRNLEKRKVLWKYNFKYFDINC